MVSSIVRSSIVLALCSGTALGCEDPACDRLSACDIRDADCHEHVMEVVACLRGVPAVRPRVRVIDEDEFVDEQVEMLDDEPLSETTTDWYRALALLDLMPESLKSEVIVRTRWRDVAAFYSSETRRVTVLDDGDSLDDGSSVILLAHEFVHVLQGEEDRFDFRANQDADMASRAMIEGEATLYQDLAHVEGLGWNASEIAWQRVFDEFRREAWLSALEEDAVYQRSDSNFAYAYGLSYLGAAYERGGAREVRRALRSAPDSTREIMAGYRAAEPEEGWVEDMTDVALPMLPDDYDLVHVERGGAFLFELFLERARVERRWPMPARSRFDADPEPSGWAGDSLSVFRAPDEELELYWRVRFASAEQAERLASVLEDDFVQIVQRDRDLIIAAATGSFRQPPGTLEWRAAPEPEPAPEPGDAAAIRCRYREPITR